MKKNTLITAAALLPFFATLGYALKIRAELKELKELNSKEIVELLREPQRQYSNATITIGGLQEPSEMTYAEPLERIEMLRQHLPFQPSPEWIRDVIQSAEREIKSLRSNSQ